MLTLRQKSYDETKDEQWQTIHSLALEYTVDGGQSVKDPRGMFGRKLQAVMHIVRAPTGMLVNLVHCLAKCHLDVESYVYGPYAAGLACLSEDDKKLGALVLDMGAGQTCFSVFKNGELLYADSIPVGGMHLTNDIALGVPTDLKHAERIKTLFGSVISSPKDEQELIDIPQHESNHEETVHIQRSMLVKIIQPRVEETLELVKQKLEAAGLSQVAGRLFVTGGASQLSGVRQFVGHVFGKRALKGEPHPVKGSAESTSGPAFSVCVGMLDYVLWQRQLEQQGLSVSEKNSLRVVLLRIGQWLKENF
jgi:cell division protein FtsA